MPGYDRTGPWGLGPRTGWGRGRCRGGAWPVPGRGYGWGGGRGCRRGWWGGPWGYASGREALEAEAEALRERLSWIERELSQTRRSEPEE